EVVDVDVAALRVDLVEDLLEDHLALELDLLEQRPGQHVAEDGERRLDPGRVDRRVIIPVITSSYAVERAAAVLHQRVHAPAVRVALAAAEEEVLEEVRDAVAHRGLVTRAGPHVGGDHPGVQVRKLDRHDPQAVVEGGLMDEIVHRVAKDKGGLTSKKGFKRTAEARSTREFVFKKKISAILRHPRLRGELLLFFTPS